MLLYRLYIDFLDYWTVYAKQDPLIIVYQMGKVGSRSVFESLKESGVKPIFHVHRMIPSNIERVKNGYRKRNVTPLNERIGPMLYNKISKGKRKAKIITLVREPLGRNISAFFENLQIFIGSDYNDTDFQLKKLIDIFIKEYSHEVPSQWFDLEFKKATGVNVYNYPFPKHKGYMTIEENNIELLIMKLEIPDALKERAIADFMHLDKFRLISQNLAKDKTYSKTYQQFKKTVRLPTAYVRNMLSSKYATHFYSEKDINALWVRWHNSPVDS